MAGLFDDLIAQSAGGAPTPAGLFDDLVEKHRHDMQPREEPFTDPMSGQVLGTQMAPPAPGYEGVRDAARFGITAGVRGGGSLLDFAADPLAPMRALVSPKLAQAEREASGPGPGTALGNAFFAGTNIPESHPQEPASRVLLSGLEGAVAGGPFGAVPAALTALGGIAGQATHEGTGDERLSTAASLAPGLLAPAAAGLRGRVSTPVEQQATSYLARDIARDQAAGGPDLDALRRLLGQDDATNAGFERKPATLADFGGTNLQGRAENIANRPGEGATVANNFVTERNTGAGPRLLGDLGQAFGNGPSAFKTAQKLSSERLAAAKPLYEQAMGVEPVYSDRLEQFTNDPIIKKGLAQGMEIQRLEKLANGESFDPAAYSVTLDDLNGPSFKPMPAAAPGAEPWRPPDIIEFLTRAGGIKDARGDLGSDLGRVDKGYFGRLTHNNGRSPDYAREIAEEAGYLPQGSEINDLYDAIQKTKAGTPVYSDLDQSAARAWHDWRNGQSQPGSSPAKSVDFGSGGVFDPNEMFKGLPRGWDMPTLDAAKRGLDNILDEYRDPTSGRLNLDQRGRAIEQVRKAYVEELDRRNPYYAEARKAWAGPSQSMAAVKQGGSIFSRQPEQIAEDIKGLSPADRDFYLIGARDALAKNIAKTSAGGNEALRIVGNKYVQDQLRPLFKDDAAYNAFIGQAQLESLMHRTDMGMRGGSPTFRRAAFNESEKPPGSAAFDTAMGITGLATGQYGMGVPWALRSANSIRNWFTNPSASPAANAEMARMLFNSDPAQQAAILDAIQNARGGGMPMPLALAPTPLGGLIPGERRR